MQLLHKVWVLLPCSALLAACDSLHILVIANVQDSSANGDSAMENQEL